MWRIYLNFSIHPVNHCLWVPKNLQLRNVVDDGYIQDHMWSFEFSLIFWEISRSVFFLDLLVGWELEHSFRASQCRIPLTGTIKKGPRYCVVYLWRDQYSDFLLFFLGSMFFGPLNHKSWCYFNWDQLVIKNDSVSCPPNSMSEKGGESTK